MDTRFVAGKVLVTEPRSARQSARQIVLLVPYPCSRAKLPDPQTIFSFYYVPILGELAVEATVTTTRFSGAVPSRTFKVPVALLAYGLTWLMAEP